MTTKNLVFAFVAAAVIGAFGYGAYRVGMNRGMQMSDVATPTATRSGTGAHCRFGDRAPARPKQAITDGGFHRCEPAS